MTKFSYEPAPLVLALVLGPMFEESLRQSMILSRGSLWIFLQHPISAVLVIISILVLVSPLLTRKKSRLTGGEG
jgi:putative tricarboxylic transport membrane protein